MARGVNKVILIGNLGGDPDVRYTPSGQAVANVFLATNETWTDKQTGEKQERTEWHRLVFFGRLAEIVHEHCRKGMPLYVEGKLQTRKWQDKQGDDRYTTEIVVNDFQMLGQKNGSSAADERAAQQYEHAHRGRPASSRSTPQTDFDDDVPF